MPRRIPIGVGESVLMPDSSSELGQLSEDQHFHGPLATGAGRVFEVFLIVAIAGPTLWFAVRAWPYDGATSCSSGARSRSTPSCCGT